MRRARASSSPESILSTSPESLLAAMLLHDLLPLQLLYLRRRVSQKPTQDAFGMLPEERGRRVILPELLLSARELDGISYQPHLTPKGMLHLDDHLPGQHLRMAQRLVNRV